MGRLSAHWRGDYITAATEEERRDVEAGHRPGDRVRCVFCAILEGGRPDADTYVLHRGATCFAILNAYPYTSGHLMVMPLRHEGELDSLTTDEHAELWDTVRHAVGALKRAYAPEGINVGVNLGRAAGAGVPGHLHVHLVPRWNGDTNFMTATAETRVVPESLARTWQRLAEAWPAPEPGNGKAIGTAGSGS